MMLMKTVWQKRSASLLARKVLPVRAFGSSANFEHVDDIFKQLNSKLEKKVEEAPVEETD